MKLRFSLPLLLSSLFSMSCGAQQVAPYSVPRTEHGHPDIQGIWVTEFATTLEALPGVENLLASPEQAAELAAMARSWLPDVHDPDFDLYDANRLAMVKGEYRTSIIVSPQARIMPYTEAAMELAMAVQLRNAQMFDHPEQRPLSERCLESMGYPPIRTAPVLQLHQIVQTAEHIVLHTEDAAGLRIIRLTSAQPSEAMRAVEGYSIGRWEDDTLVVDSTHFRDDDPARLVIARPLLYGEDTKITERFTRISETELFYQFTVEDDTYYTEPWSGEFSFTWHEGPIYEYACHEGNYSMSGILRGGQFESIQRATDGAQ